MNSEWTDDDLEGYIVTGYVAPSSLQTIFKSMIVRLFRPQMRDNQENIAIEHQNRRMGGTIHPP